MQCSKVEDRAISFFVLFIIFGGKYGAINVSHFVLPRFQPNAQRCVFPVSFPDDLLLPYYLVNPPERKLAKRTSVQCVTSSFGNLHRIITYKISVFCLNLNLKTDDNLFSFLYYQESIKIFMYVFKM